MESEDMMITLDELIAIKNHMYYLSLKEQALEGDEFCFNNINKATFLEDQDLDFYLENLEEYIWIWNIGSFGNLAMIAAYTKHEEYRDKAKLLLDNAYKFIIEEENKRSKKRWRIAGIITVITSAIMLYRRWK
jgi:hypothetical protein